MRHAPLAQRHFVLPQPGYDFLTAHDLPLAYRVPTMRKQATACHDLGQGPGVSSDICVLLATMSSPLGRSGSRGLSRASSLLPFPAFDPHSVKASINEEHGDQKEYRRERRREIRALLACEIDSQRYGQQAEQRRELDDRVQRDGTRVFERIAYRVAHDSRVMQ